MTTETDTAADEARKRLQETIDKRNRLRREADHVAGMAERARDGGYIDLQSGGRSMTFGSGERHGVFREGFCKALEAYRVAVLEEVAGLDGRLIRAAAAGGDHE